MNLEFTEEQKIIRQAARDFARQECLPGVIERDDRFHAFNKIEAGQR